MTLRRQNRSRRSRQDSPRLSHPKSNRPKIRLPSLPLEIVAIILGYLPDFRALFRAVQTCKLSYNAYQAHGHQVVPAIFGRECAAVKGHNVGRIFWELDFAIRHSFMARSHVQAALLEQGWPLFQCLQLEELLIPLVRALAQTLKDDRQAATAFLRAVWDGKQLFEPSDLPKLQELQLRPPTLISVGTLLAELTVDQDQTRILSDIEQLRRCEEDIRLPTNTVEHALIATVHKFIASKPGCIRPSNGIDLLVHFVFPEDETGLANLAAQLEVQERERDATAVIKAETGSMSCNCVSSPERTTPTFAAASSVAPTASI
ncbi:hypothetical protein NKR23_g12300 [Pleurostoma richardsiae]|uniref:F-box domain-containing protein n=1 Tax=Pleurostoma richardsiae TaxID=41990 RepID=A0AA38VIR0_9PEZI|nr:hypothetical protein NKR23_g12300 [Pleurostoma richardsiae]